VNRTSHDPKPSKGEDTRAEGLVAERTRVSTRCGLPGPPRPHALRPMLLQGTRGLDGTVHTGGGDLPPNGSQPNRREGGVRRTHE
jgi:hypothetical protein